MVYKSSDGISFSSASRTATDLFMWHGKSDAAAAPQSARHGGLDGRAGAGSWRVMGVAWNLFGDGTVVEIDKDRFNFNGC